MRHRLAAVLAAALTSAAIVAAQDPPALDAGRVRDLLVLLAAPDPRGALDAVRELEALGPGVAPALVEMLKKDSACRVQWLASDVLARLQLEPALVETTRIEMVHGRCRASSTADLNLQQDAALALIDRPRGIALMTGLLRDRDPLVRRRAVFAFDDLTARLLPEHPRTIAASPEILAATDAALKPLRDAAVSQAHAEIRCPAFEAIDQARRLPHAALAARATSLLQDVTVDCGSPRGTVKPGPVPNDRMRRDSWPEIIARLDKQTPELAAQTTSALLAANEDVVPLLRQRLQRTDSCRGLALVAGILAGRNTAEADVVATFDRVATGACDGREPFDLTLAQSAADALLARAAGVTRLTGLLIDRDVAVRRRAARALATLFDRLGMGEAARPESDQALLEAARAAVAPLVTLATTERDEAARCQGVRAILRAQQSVHDAIRADADGASAGRTLRCLAPPNP